MAVTSVVNYADKREIGFPVSGAGSNIPLGTGMMPGATLGLNSGILIPWTAASNLHCLGILASPHNFGASGDALTATLGQWYPLAGFNGGSTLLGNTVQANAFPSHAVELCDTAVLVKMSYNLASTMAVASYSAGGPTVTITNEITGKDSGFLYINAGTGIGQLGFITQSNAGSDTMATAFTVALDNTSKLTQVLPLFYQLPVWKVNSTTVGTLLDSTAAVGTGRASFIMNFIQLNGDIFQLDPKTFNNYQGLNVLAQFDLFSFLAMQSTTFHPVS